MEVLRDADIDMAASPANGLPCSATAIRAARRHSTSRTAASTSSSACAAHPAARRPREEAGLAVMLVEDAVASADVIMFLAPDEALAGIYREVEPRIRQGAAIGFSHGLVIHFGLVQPRADLDVFLVAPKGPGTALRSLYEQGKGMVGLWAVAQDASGRPRDIALAYGKAIGCARAGPARIDLRRGMRVRSVQRGRGRLGRGAGNPHRRLRDADRGRHFSRSRLPGMRRRIEAACRTDREARHRRHARGDFQHGRARRRLGRTARGRCVRPRQDARRAGRGAKRPVCRGAREEAEAGYPHAGKGANGGEQASGRTSVFANCSGWTTPSRSPRGLR